MIVETPKKRGPKPGPVRPVRPTRHSGKPGPRPEMWKIGTDPLRHRMYIAYGRAKCQAVWRGEGWDMTFEEYEAMWQGRWHLRGRTRDTLCLARLDYDLPWSITNCDIITRREHNIRQAQWRMEHR